MGRYPRWTASTWGLGLFLLACGGGGDGAEGAGQAATARATAGAGSAGARRPALDWVDPEPPGAQALAEEVVRAAWNVGKTTRLSPARTTRLAMKITTLMDRTTGLQGFRSGLAGQEASLSDRLSRLGARETATEVTIRLPGSVLFDFDSAAVRPDAERTLLEVVEVLNAYGSRPVRIEGHTDAVASEEYNQRLSTQRAEAVRAWLAAHGVAAGRLATAGRGEASPVADNATAAGRQLNRRVEIVVEKGAASSPA